MRRLSIGANAAHRPFFGHPIRSFTTPYTRMLPDILDER
jgi:hypothetical protein